MPVYIDSYNAKFRRMIMCHMMADTTQELLAMADNIGLSRKWIQHAGTNHEHFDVCLSAKKKALASGAIEVGWREMTIIMNAKAVAIQFGRRSAMMYEEQLPRDMPQADYDEWFTRSEVINCRRMGPLYILKKTLL